jgi:trehalose/maltose hydrolase-like predicted phosphorylase
MNKHLLVVFIILYQVNALCGQVKYEREYRIKGDQIPDQAMEFVESFQFDGKVKWYKEESSTGSFIEAKTKFKSEKYSIEFDSTGVIEDIEIEVDWKDIPTTTRTAIDTYLTANFRKTRIYKIQSQYLGQTSILQQLNTLRPAFSNDKINVNYELVVKVKKGKERSLKELLFDDQGILLKQSTIVFKNTDNLEY